MKRKNKRFYLGKRKESNHLEDLDIDGSILDVDLKETVYEVVYWVQVARNRVQ